MRKFGILAGLLSGSVLAHAQEAVASAAGAVPAFTGPTFFISLLVGFILAAAFQTVLTTLSVAAGVSALRPATSPARGRAADAESGRERSSVQRTIRNVGAGFGDRKSK